MDITRRELLKGGAALGVAGAAPQALLRAAQAQGTQKKELVVAQAGDIAKFDPHFSTASQDIRISFNLFDNLTSRHPDGKLYPGLATEWKLEGQTTWRFKLREGVRYHNGDPFTSADAKFSLERTYDPSVKTMVATVFTTTYGVTFLLVGNGLGAIIALFVFSITAIAPPLVVDRDVDFVTAMTTSVRAVQANPRPMLAWAIVIGADLAISFLTLFIALLVIFPVLGHATWHLYRRVIV